MSSSRNVRTYSRRNSSKTSTKRPSEHDEEFGSDERPAKRRVVSGPTTPKRQVTREKPGQSSRTRLGDDDNEVITDVEDDDDEEGNAMRESTPVNVCGRLRLRITTNRGSMGQNNGTGGGRLGGRNSISSVTCTFSVLALGRELIQSSLSNSFEAPAKSI